MTTEAQSQPQPSIADQVCSLLKAKGYWDRPFTFTASLKAHKGKENELIEAINKLVPPTLKEAGVITYEFYQDVSDPTYFVLQEKWKDGPSAQVHFEQTYSQEFLSLAKDISEIDLHLIAPLKPQ